MINTILAWVITGLLFTSIGLFVKASMFFGEQHFLYKEEIAMKDIFAYRVSRITFFATIFFTIIYFVV